MKVYLLILFILSFSGGSNGIILSLILYLKYKNKKILLYTFTLLFWTLNFLFMKFFTFINNELVGNNFIFNYINELISNISWGLLTFFLPMTTLVIFEKKINKLFLLMTICISIILSFPLHIIFKNYLLVILNVIQLILHFIILYYTAIVLHKNIKNINKKNIRKILKIFVFILYLFYPLLFIELNPLFIIHFKYGVGIYPIFYFILNLFWLILIGNFIYFPKIQLDFKNENLKEVYKMFSLTQRESEIVELLLDGLSYNEIADKLFISFETVKTHVNNIYKKTHVSGKIDLIKLIKKTKI